MYNKIEYERGTKLGELIYLHDIESFKERKAMFRCRCEKVFATSIAHAKSGNTKSCGCLKAEATRAACRTHGDSDTRLYSIWNTMKRRCYDSSLMNAYDYKINKIQVCDEWMTDYQAFKDWSLSNGYTDELTIDRIDSLDDYKPSNCRWADRYVQACNTKRISRTNKSGYRGVSWSKQKNKWQTKITVRGKRIYLGTYKDKKEAGMAYDKYVVDNNLPHTTNGLVPKAGY